MSGILQELDTCFFAKSTTPCVLTSWLGNGSFCVIGSRDGSKREPAQVAADSLAGHAWLRENLGLGPWAEAMVDRYERLAARSK